MIPAILLYLAFAALTLLYPESQFPDALYATRRHDEAFSLVNVTVLLCLWTLATLPWLMVVYRRGASVGWKTLAGPILVVCLVSVWIRPPFTHDIYVYVCQGRQLTAYGVSPYSANMWGFLSDPVIGKADNTWFNLTSMFGPLAVGTFALSNVICPVVSLLALGRTLKALLLIPYAIFAGIWWRRWRENPDRPTLMLAVFANPATISMVMVEGHIEILFLIFLVAAGLSLEREREYPAALALCAAACIKISAIVILPVCACWLWRSDKGRAVRFFLTFLALYAAIYAMIGGGEWSEVMRVSRGWSDPRWHNCIPQLVFFTGVGSLPFVCNVSNGCFFLAIGALCLANLTGKIRNNVFFSMALGLIALYLTRTYTQPWYTMWFWPLLWLSDGRTRVTLISIALWTGCLLLMTLNRLVWVAAPWVVLVALVIDIFWLRAASKNA